jgi:hypothetical protein
MALVPVQDAGKPSGPLTSGSMKVWASWLEAPLEWALVWTSSSSAAGFALAEWVPVSSAPLLLLALPLAELLASPPEMDLQLPPLGLEPPSG